jgi:hypothetical protein
LERRGSRSGRETVGEESGRGCEGRGREEGRG